MHFTHELSTRELEVLTGLTSSDDAMMDPMWNDYDKLSINFDKLSVKILSNLVEVG